MMHSTCVALASEWIDLFRFFFGAFVVVVSIAVIVVIRVNGIIVSLRASSCIVVIIVVVFVVTVRFVIRCRWGLNTVSMPMPIVFIVHDRWHVVIGGAVHKWRHLIVRR
ncbi:hypothetical protein [Lentibacter algarum]|uniref:hypothetical protein n=1 Tax=Lentibacter algarum TaxID=576131 RepID=UPI003BB04DE6